MTQYNANYNGKQISEQELVRVMRRNEPNLSHAIERLYADIEWAVENCSNLNNIFLANAVEYLWSDDYGIWNNDLRNFMNRVIEDYVVDGTLIEW